MKVALNKHQERKCLIFELNVSSSSPAINVAEYILNLYFSFIPHGWKDNASFPIYAMLKSSFLGIDPILPNYNLSVSLSFAIIQHSPYWTISWSLLKYNRCCSNYLLRVRFQFSICFLFFVLDSRWTIEMYKLRV